MFKIQGMENIIARLRSEKNYFYSGYAAGLMWANDASYPDLRYVAEVFYFDAFSPSFGLYTVDAIYGDSIFGNYFYDFFESDPKTKVQDYDGYFSRAAQCWLRGWFNAVHDFWGKIFAEVVMMPDNRPCDNV
jgi:hypothetical protein